MWLPDYNQIKSPWDLKHPLNGLYLSYFNRFIHRFDNFRGSSKSGTTLRFHYRFDCITGRRMQYEEYLNIEIDEVHIYDDEIAKRNSGEVYREYYLANIHEHLGQNLTKVGQYYNMPDRFKFHIQELLFHPLNEWDGK
jgi:hypothetical protein